MKKKIHLAILISISVYFLARLAMLFAMADKNHLFIYNNHDIDLLLPYADVAFTLLFFFSFYHFFKNNRAMKYISIALMIFFIPFSILAAFLYVSMNANDDYSRHFFNEEELLVVIGHMKGLHPESGDPRNIYLYEKTAPFIYEKIGQSWIELGNEGLATLSDMRIDVKELSVEINERRIFIERNE